MSDLGPAVGRSRAMPPAGDWTASPGSPDRFVRAQPDAPGPAIQRARVEFGTVSRPHAQDQGEQVSVLDGRGYADTGTGRPARPFVVRATGVLPSGGSRHGATVPVVAGDAR